MEWDPERIIFNPEWNYFCFRKGPVKQKPGERKGGRKERKRKRDRGRKEGRKKENKCLNIAVEYITCFLYFSISQLRLITSALCKDQIRDYLSTFIPLLHTLMHIQRHLYADFSFSHLKSIMYQAWHTLSINSQSHNLEHILLNSV